MLLLCSARRLMYTERLLCKHCLQALLQTVRRLVASTQAATQCCSMPFGTLPISAVHAYSARNRHQQCTATVGSVWPKVLANMLIDSCCQMVCLSLRWEWSWGTPLIPVLYTMRQIYHLGTHVLGQTARRVSIGQQYGSRHLNSSDLGKCHGRGGSLVIFGDTERDLCILDITPQAASVHTPVLPVAEPYTGQKRNLLLRCCCCTVCERSGGCQRTSLFSCQGFLRHARATLFAS